MWIFSQQCRVPFSQEFRLLNATSLRCVEADCSVTFCFSLLWRCISCYSSRIKTQGLVGQFLGQSRLLTIWISKILYLNIGSGSREGSPPLVRAHAVTKSIASTDYFWRDLYYEARTPEGATAYPCAGFHRRILASGETWRARAYGRSNHRTRATALTANHYRIIISYISGENGALRANVCLFWFSKEDK